MTLKSPREIERLLEEFNGGDDDSVGPVVAFKRPNGTIVDGDGERITDFGEGAPKIVLPDDVTSEWEGDYGLELEGSDA